MKNVLLPALLLCTAGPAALAQDPVFLNADGLVWTAAPPSLPKGAKVAVLQGDPAKDGPYTIRLKAPAGCLVAPHCHTKGEALTVIHGTLYIGMGETADKTQAKVLKTAGYHYLPPRAHHFAYSKGPVEVQISGEGPADVVYLNAADDPSAHK